MGLNTTPRTWVAGETVSAAEMNTEVRDAITGIEAAWTAYSPSWTSTGTAPVLGNGTLTGSYLRIGHTIFYKIRLTAGSTTTFGTLTYQLSLPVAAANVTAYDDLGGVVANIAAVKYAGAAFVATSIQVQILFGSTIMTPTSPGTFASGNTISVNGSFEAA
jgi:hypothetical protein